MSLNFWTRTLLKNRLQIDTGVEILMEFQKEFKDSLNKRSVHTTIHQIFHYAQYFLYAWASIGYLLKRGED